MSDDPITIDIWSDIACPWCYIGKRRLEAGMAAFATEPGRPEVVVEYHSFELSPDTPIDYAGSTVDFLTARKGLPAAQVEQMLTHVTRLAADEGLDYDFDALRHTRTLAAHQLLHHAKAHGVQVEMKERLMHAYFTEGRHLGRPEVLADLAADIGLDRDEVLRALASEEYLPAVQADIRRAAQYGITGVPFYVIDGAYGISGAQRADTFATALQQVADERRSASPAA